MAKSPTKVKRDKHGRFIKASSGSYFPQIKRMIPAFHLWRWLIGLVIFAILALEIVQFGQQLYSSYNEAQLKQAQKQEIEAQIYKWEQVVVLHPNYRDGYFQLAILSYRLNRINETKMYLNKVFSLDPNYQPAREFEKKIR